MTIPAKSGCTNEGFDWLDASSPENFLVGNMEEPFDLQNSSHSRGPYGQNMHFSAGRFMAWILLWHDNMICLKPKSTSKNCFRPTSHVLCTCAFLIWIFNESKTNGANVCLILVSSERTQSLMSLLLTLCKNQPKQTESYLPKSNYDYSNFKFW